MSQYISDVAYNITSGKTGSDIFKVQSTLVDYIASGFSGAIATTGIGVIGSKIANMAIDGASYLLNCAIYGEQFNTVEFGLSLVLSAATADKGINAKKLKSIYNHSNTLLKTAVSERRKLFYTNKINDGANQVAKEIFSTIKQGVVFSGIDGFFVSVNEWVPYR